VTTYVALGRSERAWRRRYAGCFVRNEKATNAPNHERILFLGPKSCQEASLDVAFASQVLCDMEPVPALSLMARRCRLL
jgi:hypothetical protein